MRYDFLSAALGACFVALAAQGADPFAENIRPTEPLPSNVQEQRFRLPDGFSIQCFAAEPDIAKPMNLAFDARGRLWVTVTREYPYPVPAGRVGRDEIRILDDTDGDGRADRVSVFADGLNIPIGLYPWQDGCIVWSIPNIWWLRDTDGDGRADRREVLYGPLGWERDTHGNNSSFTRGFDGWLYATHGYNNETTLRGRDGNEVRMESGNTYRLRLDGSRVEHHTWGQVNPFGLCFDSRGNLYSADCHSEAVYQLLAGAHYPSFGKPHDGLGFAPSMIFHDHGSTAISGIWFYEGDDWPEEFRDNVFTGNVMTSRVNRDLVTFTGATPLANAKPDLVISEDPWFRPVCLQLGPDGALYIADFYNRIIGHYEVPLDHPGRDRERGRIWRVTARPKATAPTTPVSSGAARPVRFDLTSASPQMLIEELASANATRRRLATEQLTDRLGPAATEPLRSFLEKNQTQAPARQVAHALWALHRNAGLSLDELRRHARHADSSVRVHAMRILASWPEVPSPTVSDPGRRSPAPTDWTADAVRTLAREHLSDSDALVQRCAAEVLGRQPHVDNIRPLLDILQRLPKEDTHGVHAVRMALRDQLLLPGALAPFRGPGVRVADARALADAALGAGSPEAGSFLLAHVQRVEEPRERLAECLRHAARHAPASDLDALAQFARSQFAADPDLQLALFQSVQQGVAQRGGATPPSLKSWGAELASRLLAGVEVHALNWINAPVPGMSDLTNPWFRQRRASADGDRDSLFVCSLPPGGEPLTGILRSVPFPVPPRLSFFVAGHDGSPEQPAHGRNRIRLVEVKTGQVLAETPAPRNDLATPITWNLAPYVGRTAQLEFVDADNGAAYAWIAAGRFDPAVVPLPAVDPSQIPQRHVAAAELVASLGLAHLQDPLLELFGHPAVEPPARAAIGRALLAFRPDPRLDALVPLLAEPTVPVSLQQRAFEAWKAHDEIAITNAVLEAFRTVPNRLQVVLARQLAGNVRGAELLLTLAADHRAPASLLLDRNVKTRLSQGKPAAILRQATALTQGLTPPDAARQQLIEARRAAYQQSGGVVTNGNEVFTKNCRPCHQIDAVGAIIGPQLDGIGGRGLERLLEDVMDPNRNVDRAFRNTLLMLKDGDMISGLFRREVGETLVLADSTGKEIVVPKLTVHERRESEISLMPDNFGEVIPANEFLDLLAYLLSRNATKTE